MYNIEIEDAYEVFESSKHLANDGTYYLMSLICILDGDYALAHQYMKKANEEDKDMPLHIMMEGVILYWELLPSNMIYGDSLLPSMYVANLISEVYRHESGTPYKDIGIGMLVLSVTADMPEYYRNMIRKNASIAPIIEKFEDNFVYLGEKDFILREHFNQWLEDAMKQGIDCSIIRTNETTKREYTITFIVNELFHQGFKIEYIDDARNKRIHYFRIDQAMLLCQDALLRTKGLLSLSSFITDLDMKECQRNLNRKNWGEIVDKIVSEIKSREDYIVYIIRYMLENETQLFSIEDLFPDSIELFENVLANNSEDDVFKRGNQWLQDSDKNVLNIFWQLIIYIYNYFRRSETYLTFRSNHIYSLPKHNHIPCLCILRQCLFFLQGLYFF